MANSMTGYGHAEVSAEGRKFTTEIKSVNNRYLDLNIRLPRQLNPFEAKIREELKKTIHRGKVDVYISCENLEDQGTKVRYNRTLAGEYLQNIRSISEDYGLPVNLSAERLSQYPEVLVLETTDEVNEELPLPLLASVQKAAEQFSEARAREGAFITEDLLRKLDGLQEGVEKIRANAPVILEKYRAGLYARMKEILQDTQIDETRILQEAALYSDKICVDEEMVRLESHIRAVRAELCKNDESVGRKLDFLAQELNREANTILSKTDNAESADIAIGLKTEIEKIREQIQNLE